MQKPKWAVNLYERAKGAVTTSAPKRSIDEMKEVIDAAADFDKLVVMPGFERICKHLVSGVQSEIAEATQYKYEPDRQKVHVIRWDAKRELVDSMMAYIDSMQRSRDEVVEQYKNRDAVTS